MRQRLSRRALLSAAARAGVGAAGLALVGCGEDEPAPSVPTPQAERQAAEQQAVAVDVQASRQQQQRGSDDLPDAAPPQAAQQEREVRQPVIEPGSQYDPLAWRERYHWRRLQELAGQQLGPTRGGELFLDAPSVMEWSPFAGRDSYGPRTANRNQLIPLVYSQLVSIAADDYSDAHRTNVGGDLAAAWEWVDPLTLVFTLQHEV